MAELTIQQLRTLNAPALPIAPDTAVIEAQQTERTAGTQSTGVTVSEIVATGGRVVETAVAYETEYADSIVNATASNITITIGDDMRIGSRKLVRRTAEYDGNPVTITPPSGATLEGLASINLYGQYSFVELERISATVFAIKDLDDAFEYVPSAGITNLPGAWLTSHGKCIIKKGKVFIRQIYTASGAATGALSLTQGVIIPAGLTIVSERAKQIGFRSSASILGSGIFDGNGNFWTADGVPWSINDPITWKNGDTIYFYLDYTL